MLHEQGMFLFPWGSGMQHKRPCCCRLCIHFSSLSLSLRNEVSLRSLQLSLRAPLLSCWRLSLELGLPQIGTAIQMFRACDLSPFGRGGFGELGTVGTSQAEGD